MPTRSVLCDEREEHCPKADEEAHILLIEPRGTLNTGDAGGDRTAPERMI